MLTLLFFLILLDGATAVLKESPQYVTTAPSTFTIGNIKNMKPAKFINNLKSQKARFNLSSFLVIEPNMLITLLGLKQELSRDKTNGLPFHFYRSRTLHWLGWGPLGTRGNAETGCHLSHSGNCCYLIPQYLLFFSHFFAQILSYLKILNRLRRMVLHLFGSYFFLSRKEMYPL